jgi:microcystin-dependent protein
MLVGAIMQWFGPTPPPGALACDGSTFDPAEHPALYAALGNSNVLPSLPGTPMNIIWTYRQLYPPATITRWAGGDAPAPDALACDGATVRAAEYPELWRALGNAAAPTADDVITLPNIPGIPISIIWT